jgi:hypothetical protein
VAIKSAHVYHMQCVTYAMHWGCGPGRAPHRKATAKQLHTGGWSVRQVAVSIAPQSHTFLRFRRLGASGGDGREQREVGRGWVPLVLSFRDLASHLILAVNTANCHVRSVYSEVHDTVCFLEW